MPVAIPTWRNVEFTPLAMPARATGTTPTAVEASGGLIIPMPMPVTIRPGIRWVHAESVVEAVQQQQTDPEDQEARRDQPLDRARAR